MSFIGSLINKVPYLKDKYITEQEGLENFDAWYSKQGKWRRHGRKRKAADYEALKSVWKEAGSPLIHSGTSSASFEKRNPGRAHFVSKPWYTGKSGFGRDQIYNIKNYDKMFAELGHSTQWKDKGMLGRLALDTRVGLEHDDPTWQMIKEGDFGMYNKKSIDFSNRINEFGLKDVWALETQAHGSKDFGEGHDDVIKRSYKNAFSQR